VDVFIGIRVNLTRQSYDLLPFKSSFIPSPYIFLILTKDRGNK
jgi:hypothetical protein